MDESFVVEPRRDTPEPPPAADPLQFEAAPRQQPVPGGRIVPDEPLLEIPAVEPVVVPLHSEAAAPADPAPPPAYVHESPPIPVATSEVIRSGSMIFGIGAGIAAGAVSAAVLATTVSVVDIHPAYLLPLLGIVVGLAVRSGSQGRGSRFGYVALAITAAASAAGYLVATYFKAATQANLGAMEGFSTFSLGQIVSARMQKLSLLDVALLLAALVIAYALAADIGGGRPVPSRTSQ